MQKFPSALAKRTLASSHEIKTLAPWKKNYDPSRQHIKKQRHYFADKCPSSQTYGFSSSHVWIWEWNIKKAECQRIDAFELWCWRRLQKIFIGRTDAKAETPILWPPDLKNWLTWKHPDPGKDWRLEEKEMTEDEIVGWHHQLNGHEFE